MTVRRLDGTGAIGVDVAGPAEAPGSPAEPPLEPQLPDQASRQLVDPAQGSQRPGLAVPAPRAGAQVRLATDRAQLDPRIRALMDGVQAGRVPLGLPSAVEELNRSFEAGLVGDGDWQEVWS